MREVTTSAMVPVFLGGKPKVVRNRRKDKLMDKVSLAVDLVNEMDLPSDDVMVALFEDNPEKIAELATVSIKDEDDRAEMKTQIMNRIGDAE